MNIYFSPSECGFYPIADKPLYEAGAGWPSDALPISDEDYHTLLAGQIVGKTIMPGERGYPTLRDPLPPSAEEQRQQAESEKRQLLGVAKEKIAIWQDAMDLGMATNAEKITLTEWRKYRVLLNRVDCSTAPDIDWPEQPK
ncbi:phage tail fiber assembly [Xenorhabdus mauleonii]|uniref:Phage tail fiber assembly n=1 Tax=Xenorhabdus mauleonii TaxID=351675 RepID=A0A1I3R9A2_9GAMM|nr:tail fiber assembly protein [Xenorhabdus mauleonii]PHM39810.1 phage tail fiber assembly [Xenorhabdus mauleonii]SFJ43183.1 virus tail fibre assembly protein, lambda gpK [Xenorhabdus mauleonii]